MTWVDCSGSGSAFTSWAADLGAWTGTWPMQAPNVVVGLTVGVEIDFVVALPNPSDPTNPRAAIDGSYATPLWSARRQRTTVPPDYVGYSSAGLGGAPPPAPGDTPPVGAHFYVAIYGMTPPYSPETYAPASYASGGTAPEPTGHWSAWQPGFSLTKTVSASSGTSWVTSSDSQTDGPTGNQDAMLGTSLTILQAAADAADTSGGFGSLLVVGVNKLPADLTNPGFVHTLLEINQWTYNWDANPQNPFPAPLYSMTEGVDYGTAPFSDGPAEYVSADPASYSWPDSMNIECGGKIDTQTGTAAGITPPHTTLEIDVLAGPVAPGTLGPVAGTTTIFSIPIPADEYDRVGFTGANGIIRSVTLPSGLGTAFTLAVEPATIFGAWDSAATPIFSGEGEYVWSIRFSLGDETTGVLGQLTFTWETTQWRYWIPDTSSDLFWHTVGGHWATPGASTMRILTPGVGWVDVVDGPA